MRITNPLPQLILHRVIRARIRVEKALWDKRVPLEVLRGPVQKSFVPPAEAAHLPFTPLRPRDLVGAREDLWGFCWLRTEFPSAAPGEEGRRYLLWKSGGETTAFINGKPWAGLDRQHLSCPLPDAGGPLWLIVGLWGLFGGTEGDAYGFQFNSAEIGARNELAWKVYWDLDVLLQLVKIHYHAEFDLPLNQPAWGYQQPHEDISPLLRRLLRGLDDAVDAFDRDGLAAFSAGLDQCFARFPAEAWQPGAALSGHAHLDLVWLWPEHATNLKAIHTFATQLRLMEKYPEFIFTQSQTAEYRAVEKDAPELYREVLSRVREGRWEATGAMEVEMDTQLPCGESMARSVLLAQKKFQEMRGAPSTLCWVPDVFGYTACLPQVLALCGVRGFFTTKMTWSSITRFPYSSFVWRGADGTEVLTHLCSVNYNGSAEMGNVIEALRQHRQCDAHPEMLLPTGFGDGGGGVTDEMLERARRMGNLANVPPVRWTTAEAFFDRMAEAKDRLPVYQGELYLEYHRGTYTTQSEFKRLHRAAERALGQREAVRAALGLGPLPDEAWLRVLFCQFHDAIPGSSIALVYEQLCPELNDIARRELDAAGNDFQSAQAGEGWVAFNTLAVERSVVVEHPADGGAPVAITLPALGGTGLSGEGGIENPVVTATPRVLSNGLLVAGFNADGQLESLAVDGAPLRLNGPAHFALYYDEAHQYDAWDIDHYVLKSPRGCAEKLDLQVMEQGPARARLRGSAAIGTSSRLTVDYILEAGARWLKVEAAVDWREEHQLLKFHAPTRYNGRWARFGNPFGSIQRPQQPGDQSDEAMWEVPGNRWAAVTLEDGEGLALVTEAKYGFSCKDGDLGISLLRSPSDPSDPGRLSDRGEHLIRFAIGRHEPETRAGGTFATALAADVLYTPPLLVQNAKPLPQPFALENLGSLVPSWTLPAQAGGYVLRFHETDGRAGTARIRFRRTPAAVELVNLLEEPLAACARAGVEPVEYEVPYQPYQILSVRVKY